MDISLSSPDTKKINRLRRAHRGFQALCLLWMLHAVIGLIVLVYGLIQIPVGGFFDSILCVLCLLFYLFQIAATAGLWIRSSQGRSMGILLSCLALISVPLGTLIGLFGLYLLFQFPQLFGPDRIKSDELNAEYKRRKAADSHSIS